jgi:predicted PurR-regulated permease PerM
MPRDERSERPAPAERIDERTLHLATHRDRDRMHLAVLLVAAGVAVYLLLKLLAPFTLAIVTAAVIAVLARGAYHAVLRRVRNESGAALLVTIFVFVLVVAPLAGLLVLVMRDLQSGISLISGGLEDFGDQQGRAWHLFESAASWIGVDPESLRDTIGEQASSLGGALAGGTLGLLTGLGGWIVQGGIGLFTLFYLLRDGPAFVEVGRWLIPLEEPLTDALIAKTHEVIVATVLGALLVALVQGALGGLLFWALGLSGPALWGGVMAFAGLLPAIGPPVVWIPAAVMLALTDELPKAIILTAVGTLIIGTVDNVLRAVLVGGRARLHSLIVFFSVLGGLVVFGVAGFLLGPILVVIALAVLEIARVALKGQGGEEAVANGGTILAQVTISHRPRRARRSRGAESSVA